LKVYNHSPPAKPMEKSSLLRYARSLIEASLDPMITLNLEGLITDHNGAFTKITGLPNEELDGTSFFSYFTEPADARKMFDSLLKPNTVADWPLTLVQKSGTPTDILLNGRVYHNDSNKVIGVVMVARDITAQKLIERELTEAKEFAELASASAEEAKTKAESAQQLAENAVKAKQQFLSNMSHEIRTPMNAIIGFTKVALKTNLSAKQKEYLNAIKISGDAMIVLINDILDLAKVEAGKMTFEAIPFKMAVSLHAMLHIFETKIQEKNLQLLKEYDDHIPEILIGDPVRLHQIIMNLVSNAVKFTNTGHITISVRLLGENTETATIGFSVSDTGIGIPEDKLEHIFENFQQASSSTSRMYGGTGLGLAIVKQLVEGQGGKIAVSSTVDVGSEFSFTLGYRKTNRDTAAEDILPVTEKQLDNVRVLVVEDIPLNQLLMKTLLDDFGFECVIAANGKIAIEKVKEQSFSIILMDLQMPEMNGFEATEYIRNTLLTDTPIIALTADVTTTDLDKCKAVGMNDYIAKPVDERLLYTKIVNHIQKYEASREQLQAETPAEKKARCINLEYLGHRTKSDPKLMMEMISLYLEQTPPLITSMKKSLQEKDWDGLHAAVHKIIPSFSIMGINSDFEHKAKRLQDYATGQKQADVIPELVQELENICMQACTELQEEFDRMKSSTNDK
jgi:PAS domain S-box-containing protein